MRLFLVPVLTLSIVSHALAAPTTAERGREVFLMLAEERFDDFLAAGTPTMQAAMNARQVAAFWSQLGGQVGKFKSIADATQLSPAQGMQQVLVKGEFERGALALRFVLDAEQRVAGMWLGEIDTGTTDPPPYANPDRFTEEEITVRCGRFELPGTLTLPKRAGRVPAVVLVHGSGPHDRDETITGNKPFRDLAWGLASRGIAVVRYEKRTKAHGHQMDVTKITLNDETIDDAVAAARLLHDRPEINPQRIFVLGHSLGGMAAPFIAQQYDGVAGIIICAGNARPLTALVEEQLNYLFRLDGELSSDEQAQLALLERSLADLAADRVTDQTPPILGAPASYWAGLGKLDHVAAATRLTCPILVLQGARDYQVTTEDFRIWQQRLVDHPRVQFRLYPDLNHLMMAGTGKSTPGEYGVSGHVAEQVITDVATWIQQPRAK